MVSLSTGKVREVAGGHADTMRESYRTVVDRAFAARESNSRLARDFFEKTVEELQEQARLNRCAMNRLSARADERDEALSMYSFPGPSDRTPN